MLRGLRALNGAGRARRLRASCRAHASPLRRGSLRCSLLAAPTRRRIPYRTVTGWMAAPEGRTFGSMSMVDVAPDGTLWIAERCGANDCLANGDIDPILHVAASGEWLGAFGAGLFAWPHGIYVDAGGNVWVTDARGGDAVGHQVIKFAPNGRELLRLGTSAHAGDGRDALQWPDRRRRRAERRRVRQRRPRADVEQPHREVLGRRPLYQGMGRQRQRTGPVPRAARARARFARAAVRRGPRQQPHPDLRPGRQLFGAVDAVRAAERNSHRGRRHALRVGQSIERRASSRLAARPLRRQREGRHRSARSFRTPSSIPPRRKRPARTA